MPKAFTTARRAISTPEIKNAAHQLLADPCKGLLPPLHIKLGPMKCFVEGTRQKWTSILIPVCEIPKMYNGKD